MVSDSKAASTDAAMIAGQRQRARSSASVSRKPNGA